MANSDCNSVRIKKPRFNVLKIVGVEDEPNHFIVGLIICFFAFVISPVTGIILVVLDTTWLSVLFFGMFPLLGIIALFVAVKYYLNAKKIYVSGKAYITETNHNSLDFDCKIVLDNSRVIRRPTAHLRFNNTRIFVVYSEELDECIFLRKVPPNISKIENAVILKENAQIERHIEKIERKYKNHNVISFKNIAASDKNINYTIPVICISAILLIMCVTSALTINFLLSQKIDFVTIINVVISAFCVILLVILIVNIVILIHLKVILKDASFVTAKLLGIVFKEVNKSDIGELTDSRFAVKYQVEIDGQLYERISNYSYNEKSEKLLKKLKKFPILYNKKHDCAIYFTAKHCVYINKCHNKI